MTDADMPLQSRVRLERLMLIAYDTRKVFARDKASMKWTWHDRDEEADWSDEGRLFDWFWQALCDATEPYDLDDGVVVSRRLDPPFDDEAQAPPGLPPTDDHEEHTAYGGGDEHPHQNLSCFL